MKPLEGMQSLLQALKKMKTELYASMSGKELILME
jgi:hypothetical protein